jgi:hypothetical protein
VPVQPVAPKTSRSELPDALNVGRAPVIGAGREPGNRLACTLSALPRRAPTPGMVTAQLPLAVRAFADMKVVLSPASIAVATMATIISRVVWFIISHSVYVTMIYLV